MPLMRSMVRAAGGQLFLEPLEAAVEMVDAVDHGLAFRGEAGDDQRDRGAQIGRHHRRAAQLGVPSTSRFRRRAVIFARRAGQLLHMHEAVLEDRLGDARGALGPSSSAP
jgi:hypothetical protein